MNNEFFKPYKHTDGHVWLPVNEHRYMKRYYNGFTCFGNLNCHGTYDSAYFSTLDKIDNLISDWSLDRDDSSFDNTLGQLYFMSAITTLQMRMYAYANTEAFDDMLHNYLMTFFENDVDSPYHIDDFEIPEIEELSEEEAVEPVLFYIREDRSSDNIVAGFYITKDYHLVMSYFKDNHFVYKRMQIPMFKTTYDIDFINMNMYDLIEHGIIGLATQYMLVREGYLTCPSLNYAIPYRKFSGRSPIPKQFLSNATIIESYADLTYPQYYRTKLNLIPENFGV